MAKTGNVRKASILGFLAGLLVALALMCGSSSSMFGAKTAFAVEPAYHEYPLMLAGVRVNSLNAGDIFGDGTARYNPYTNTLTLNNFRSNADNPPSTWREYHLLYSWFQLNETLTIELHGNNALIGRAAPQTYDSSVFLAQRSGIRITGDGNLVVSGGKEPISSVNESAGMHVEGNLTFVEDFTGTVVATGPAINAIYDVSSYGVICKGTLAVHGGTLIATGGRGTTSAGVCLSNTDFDALFVDGGTFIAQGGIAQQRSFGVLGADGSQVVCRLDDGVSIVRAGLLDPGQQASSQCVAFSNANLRVDFSKQKLAGCLTYNGQTPVVNDANLPDNLDAVDSYAGMVVVPRSFQRLGGVASSTNLSSDVYRIGSASSSGPPLNRLNLGGHTAVFVNLGESTNSNTVLDGMSFSGDSRSVVGNGKLVSMGGLATQAGASSCGLLSHGTLTIEGPHVVCAGAPARSGTTGDKRGSCGLCAEGEGSNVVVRSGSLVGVGGQVSGSNNEESWGIGAHVEASGSVTVLGVGGIATNGASNGIYGNAESSDNARVAGYGGYARWSTGVCGNATARGGTLVGVGAAASETSIGCNCMVSHEGALAVGLGGVVPSNSGCASYGQKVGPPYADEQASCGRLVVAGHTKAYGGYSVDTGFRSFFACSGGATGVAYPDFWGTQQGTAVNYRTTQQTLANYKRIVVGELDTNTFSLTLHLSTVNGVDQVAPIVISGISPGTSTADALAAKGYSLGVCPFTLSGYSSCRILHNDARFVNKAHSQPLTQHNSWEQTSWDLIPDDESVVADKDIYYYLVKDIRTIYLGITQPLCGTATNTPKIGQSWYLAGQTNKLELSVAIDPHCSVSAGYWFEDTFDPYASDDDNPDPFVGSFEGGSQYHALAFIGDVEFGYQLGANLDFGFFGATLEKSRLGEGDEQGLAATISIRVPAFHDWRGPTYTWQGTSRVTVEGVCKGNSAHRHTETVSTIATVVAQPTCTTKGTTTYTALFDDASFETQEKTVADVEALGHKWGAWTKLNDKQHQRMCSRDKSHVEKANHTWDAGKVTKAPTANAAGVRTYTCTTCKANRSESIPKLATWKRLAGTNALKTMEQITKEYGKATTAIVTTNALAAKGVDPGYKDALAAAALAGGFNAPMLTTSKGALSAETKSELKRMGVKTVYLVGSTAEVVAKVDTQIKNMGITVKRISAKTASERAVAAARQIKGRSDTVVIATQNNFKDALAISSYAYATKSPILYAETSKKLSAATVNYIKTTKFKKAIIVGGPVALPASIEGQLKSAGIAANAITRLAGSNQYKTARVIAEWACGKLKNGTGGGKDANNLYYYASVKFQPSVKLTANKLGVARADDDKIGWKDALAGAALCGKNKSVVLLADAVNDGHAVAFVKANTVAIQYGYVFGGVLAVPKATMDKLIAAGQTSAGTLLSTSASGGKATQGSAGSAPLGVTPSTPNPVGLDVEGSGCLTVSV